jgi:hypothetical protein
MHKEELTFSTRPKSEIYLKKLDKKAQSKKIDVIIDGKLSMLVSIIPP